MFSQDIARYQMQERLQDAERERLARRARAASRELRTRRSWPLLTIRRLARFAGAS